MKLYKAFRKICIILLYRKILGPPCGSVVKNLLANAGDTGSIPDPGRSYMTQSNKVCVPQLLSLHSRARELQLATCHNYWSMCPLEPVLCGERGHHHENPPTTTKEHPPSLQLETSPCSDEPKTHKYINSKRNTLLKMKYNIWKTSSLIFMYSYKFTHIHIFNEYIWLYYLSLIWLLQIT